MSRCTVAAVQLTVRDRYLHAIERQQRPTVSEKLLCHGMRRRLQRREPAHLCKLTGTQIHLIHRCGSRRQLQQTALMLQRTAHTRKTYSNPKVLRQTDSVAALLAQIQYANAAGTLQHYSNVGLPALVDRGAGGRFVIVITQRAEAQAACSPAYVQDATSKRCRCWFPHRLADAQA